MCQILHKKVDGGGCKQYRNRQAKCVAFKKDDLKLRNIAFYKNVYEHFFKHGDPFYVTNLGNKHFLWRTPKNMKK